MRIFISIKPFNEHLAVGALEFALIRHKEKSGVSFDSRTRIPPVPFILRRQAPVGVRAQIEAVIIETLKEHLISPLNFIHAQSVLDNLNR